MAASSHLNSRAAKPSATQGDPELGPLPLTPFEQFMLLDDRPQYPMTFFGELRFLGELRQEAFIRAWEAAILRHPLLRSTIKVGETDFRWIAELDPPTPLDWASAETPMVASSNGYMDLKMQAGIRAWVRVGGGSSHLVFQFHHACCDGQGAMRFIEDLLIAYAAATESGSPSPELRPIDGRRLLRRGEFSVSDWSAAKIPRSGMRALLDALKFQVFGPRPLEASVRRPDATASRRFPGTHTYHFDAAESTAIRSSASARAGTLNDVAVAAVLRTLGAWNRDCGVNRGRLRVLIPIDLRARGDEQMPAANRMSFGFVTRPISAIDAPDRLVEGIRDETQYVRRSGAVLDFLQAVALLHRSPMLPWFLNRRRCWATAVLTNMGDPTRRFGYRFPRTEGRCIVGNVVLESITGSPPLRPLTRVGFGIGTYAGRIVVNAKCDPTEFSDDDTGRILAMFVDHLRGTRA